MSQNTWLTPILVWISPLSKSLIAEDGFDPSTSGLWAQHASAAPLCYFAFELGVKPSILDRGAHSVMLKRLTAEDGLDPSTSVLWAQHASAAPLCYFAFELGIKPTILDRGGHLLKLSFPTGKTKVVVTLVMVQAQISSTRV